MLTVQELEQAKMTKEQYDQWQKQCELLEAQLRKRIGIIKGTTSFKLTTLDAYDYKAYLSSGLSDFDTNYGIFKLTMDFVSNDDWNVCSETIHLMYNLYEMTLNEVFKVNGFHIEKLKTERYNSLTNLKD